MRKKVFLALGVMGVILLMVLGYWKVFVIRGSVTKVKANPEKGFNFDYYVYLPYGVKESKTKFMLVEPNNGGRVSDDHRIHEKDAQDLVRYGICHQFAYELQTPLLVPIFDRPEKDWKMYTHSLDRDTLMNKEGDLARVDLQLIKMMDDLKERLEDKGIIVEDKVLMSGFSASGSFVNRFTALHPEKVQAVAAGGVNCMPIIPAKEWDGEKVIYPIGLYDIDQIANIEFNKEEYIKVPQYIYMGSIDDNDTLPYDDAFDQEERDLIVKFLGEDMHGRWEKAKLIYKQLGIPAELIMYEGVGHGTNDEVRKDIIKFFRDNTESTNN